MSQEIPLSGSNRSGLPAQTATTQIEKFHHRHIGSRGSISDYGKRYGIGSGRQAVEPPRSTFYRDTVRRLSHVRWLDSGEGPDGFFPPETAKFELAGKHADLSCASCHRDLRFDTPRTGDQDCSTCHIDVHDASLSSDCASCHTSSRFTDVDYMVVHSATSFPLTGAHEILSCDTCHEDDLGGAYSTQETDCIACHEQDYESALAIPHRATGFDTTCEICHSTLAWTSGVSFDHVTVANGFELLGAHRRIECFGCHATPGFDLLVPLTVSGDCYSCHEGDYNREHGSAAFSTDCITCHSVDDWDDATFRDHDQNYFPIFSGKHNGEWDGCETCHQNQTSFEVFTCFNCHEHEQSEMNDEHDDVAGYAYDSLSCLSCHPRGEEDD